MAKIKRIIPFGFWPANWGLSGVRLARARAEYYFDGEDLAYQLLDIEHQDPSSASYRTAKLKLDYRYHKIGEFDFGQGLIENDDKLTENERQRDLAKYLNRYGRMTPEDLEFRLFDLSHDSKDTDAYRRDRLKLEVKFNHKTEEEADHALLDIQHDDKKTIEYQVALLGLELKWGNITENQHDKEVATLLREPWWTMVGGDQRIKGENVQMAIELDWNEFFVEFLESKGWTGSSPDEIVDKWFEEAMRQMLHLENDIDMDDGSGDPMPMAGVNRTVRDDGLTEYR